MYKDLQELKDRRALQDLVLVVLTERRDLVVRPVVRVLLALQARQARKARLERLGRLVPREPPALRVVREAPEL